jgi:hypothetical protein
MGDWYEGATVERGQWWTRNGTLFQALVGHTADDANMPVPVRAPDRPFEFVGVYDAGTTYARNQWIRSARGYSYISLADDNIGNAPPDDGGDSDYWGLFSTPGADGADGSIIDTFQEVYGTETQYHTGDIVITSEGRLCIASQDNIDQAPPSYPDIYNDYWHLLVERGGADASTLAGASLSTDTVADPGADTLVPSEQSVREALTAASVFGVYRQLLINGGFQVNQPDLTYTAATTPANNDDTYAAPDMWCILSDGNDIVDVSRESSVVPPGAAASLKLEVETASKKFGIVQFVENKDAIKYVGQVASLQFKARTTSGKVINNVRAAILSWTGTSDSITSDVVSAWNAQGSDPTWATNWEAENTPANLALIVDTWTTYKVENVAIDASGMKNLAVFIWCDDADAAVDDVVYIAGVQLNMGAICLPYASSSYSDELRRCERYFEQIGIVTAYEGICAAYAASTTLATGVLKYKQQKRVVPTITKSTASQFQVGLASTGIACTALETDLESINSARLKATVASGLTAGDGVTIRNGNYTTNYIRIDSRL